MFPIRDHNPSESVPYITYGLIAANIGIYLITLILFPDDRALYRLYADYAMIPARLTVEQTYSTLFTSTFLHAGFMHLAGNMLFLWVFGDNLEDKMGHAPFLMFYLLSGLGAGMAQYLSETMSPVPMVGASGAIAGVMGGYLLMFPKARVDILIFFVVFFRILPVPAWIMLGLWFGMQLFNGVLFNTVGGGVAYWAHAGGFVAGMILTFPLWLRAGGTGFWKRTGGHPDHPAATYRRSSVPLVRR
ncbi:rhomboid family intramembrane serine protease [Yoonia sediminilitoris]|uniref:Membrane associated rhomboid family serine protease n=1 Tax=Yoonia sediminilitoris TaxID=1286148 RepID=A0A2T6KJM7_9RHOB|nr:rhomboid family intramembrane serine protease [Yoonia sediminilitoris]PUB16167.1 membrane associated rhomboid family serine protease [Yoonia sediminilitoris]RCW96516.1 membrane associated rhomboid family serine protease [Yoonia sediminilitoris]